MSKKWSKASQSFKAGLTWFFFFFFLSGLRKCIHFISWCLHCNLLLKESPSTCIWTCLLLTIYWMTVRSLPCSRDILKINGCRWIFLQQIFEEKKLLTDNCLLSIVCFQLCMRFSMINEALNLCPTSPFLLSSVSWKLKVHEREAYRHVDITVSCLLHVIQDWPLVP